jgi:endonuclease/exonuclease/phosphatase family metal-dependent hydrolase
MLRILSSNLHHHNDSKDKNAFDEQVGIIADQNPDILVCQEVEQFTSYNGNKDSATAIKTKLQSLTGATYAMATVSDDGSASSALTHASQHVTVYVKAPLALSVHSRPTFYGGRNGVKRSAMLFSVTVGSRIINFCTFHGQHGQATPYDLESPNEGIRCAGIVDLNYQITQTFTSTSQPRIILGDMNALPYMPSMEFFFGTYFDSWMEASVKSQPPRCVDGETYLAGSPPSDATDYDRRIDYILYGKRGWSCLSWLKLLECHVIDTTRSDGSQASDHFPLLSVFDVL